LSPANNNHASSAKLVASTWFLLNLVLRYVVFNAYHDDAFSQF
jgi:hypothetical protein